MTVNFCVNPTVTIASRTYLILLSTLDSKRCPQQGQKVYRINNLFKLFVDYWELLWI